jgi:putative membrane protein
VSATEPLPPWDDGLQNERTTLAWVRTALSLLGTGALVAKQTGETVTAVALLVLTVVAAVVMILESERRHHWRGHALVAGDPVVAMHHLLVMAAIATGLSVVGVVIVAF